ncbi:MAG TPA: hypothetical protein VIR15_13180 [Intrasporangium sp.]|jgi:hypothetical protein|uniref:hypothetical protein n=1 Tax=Intrasporangium sp. TaxID=1925024 RepID=UPI002F93EDF7
MSANSGPDPTGPLPDWALAQAMDGLNDENSGGREERARQLVQDLQDEQHDEYDDPDEGGEA